MAPRPHAWIALAPLAAALALVASEHSPAGPLGFLMRPERERLLQGAVLAAALVTLAGLARHRRAPALAFALGFLALTFAAVAHVDNLRYLGGDSLAAFLGYGALLGWSLAWASSRWGPLRALVPAGAALGAAFLGTSGALLGAAPLPRGAWLALKNAHAIAGLYAAPLFALYLARHLQRRAGGGALHRGLGLAAALACVGLVMTGLNRAATGGAHFAFGATGPHRLLALASAAGVAAHVALSLANGAGARHPRSPRPALAAALAGVALALAIAWRPRPPHVARGEHAWDAATRRALLANPRTGVTAATAHGSGLPRAWLSPAARSPGCNGNVSCHRAEADGWSRSAHRFAANPAYRAVVAGLVREEGVASARLCAGCHDPLPLLAGEMRPGARYPGGPSEGVTCLVCHAAREAPGAEPGDGRYRLAALPTFGALFAAPALGTMMVYDHMDEHLAVVRDEHLRRDAMCAACHNLQLGGVPLRRTGAEFAALGARDATGATETCRSCHMPASGRHDDPERRPHDHAMLGANFGVATLDGDTRAARAAFVAAALDLGARVEGPTVRVELTNRGVGHGFPTAPLDLVEWWFELRPAGAAEGAWRRAGPERLFAERLLDRDGAPLLRHEIWRVHATEPLGERIPRGASRSWRLPLPEGAAPGARWLVRLRTRRFPAALAGALRGSGMHLDPVEVMRREVVAE